VVPNSHSSHPWNLLSFSAAGKIETNSRFWVEVVLEGHRLEVGHWGRRLL